MSERSQMTCDDVQRAVLARLDAEAPLLAPADVDAHVASCDACRAAVADLTTVHAKLDRLDLGQVDLDLWPAIRPGMVAPPLRLPRRERGAIAGLAAGLVAWRLAQLLVDLPAPVVNSVVPLALVLLVLWRLTGDPFAIRVTPLQLKEEGAS